MEILIFTALIALLAGIIKGIGGFGSSLVTIPLLLAFYPIEDIVIMMITFNVILNTMLLFENKGFSLKYIKNIAPITITGVAFTFLGLYLLDTLEGRTIEIIAGILILVAVSMKSYILTSKNPIQLKPTLPYQIIVGALSGTGNGVASIDGPPVLFYLLSTNAKKVVFKNSLAAHFLVMGFMGIVMIAIRGMYTIEILQTTGYLALFSAGGLVLGMLVSRKLNERQFSVVVLLILIILAIKMLFF